MKLKITLTKDKVILPKPSMKPQIRFFVSQILEHLQGFPFSALHFRGFAKLQMSLQSSQRGDLQPFCILIKFFSEIFSHAPSGQKISRAVPDRSPCLRHRRSQSVVPAPIVPRSPSFQCPSPPSPRRPSFLAHPQTRPGQSGDHRQSTDHRPTHPVRYSR